jgi:hypothetical protein
VQADDGHRVLSSVARTSPPARWYRRPWLYLALAVVVAGLSVFWSGQRAIDGVRANLDERLRAAGAGADAALVTLEAEQLSALRAITFTQGVGRALAARDVTKLNALVAPLHANAGVPMVDVVLPDGRVLLAIRSKGAPRPAASRRGMAAIAQSLREARGTRGGRFSTVVVLRTGAVVLTVGPVVAGKRPVGVVLVMTPLADALGRFSQQVGVDLSAYDAGGAPLATTAAQAPPGVAPETARALVGGGPIVMRYLRGNQREALGRLIVNHQAVDVLGASWPDNSHVTGRAVWLYAGLGLLCTVLVLASFRLRIVARRRR